MIMKRSEIKVAILLGSFKFKQENWLNDNTIVKRL